MNNEKNTSAVILNPERSEWVSRSHVTSVEPVVNDGAKTQCYSAKRDLYARSPKGSRLKMTENVLSLSGASSEKQKESSLILAKQNFKRSSNLSSPPQAEEPKEENITESQRLFQCPFY